MSAPVLFIVNPAAGGGKAAAEWRNTEAWLPGAGIPFDTALTTGPGDATEIAKKAVRESRPVVVAVGGDGTLNEVVNGFFHNGAPLPTTTKLAMLPLGTGGDFRRSLRIPLDHRAAVDVLKTGISRRLDAGCVTYQAYDGATAQRHFINIADAGFGGDVVHRVNNGRKLLGSATFTAASLRTLLTWKNKPMTVTIDGTAHEVVASMVAIANCQYFGGGMRMAPGASPTDGVFDVIVVGNAGKIEFIRGLGTIRNGTHLDQNNPHIQIQYGKRISITSPKTVRLDLDGEQPGTLPALFEIQPSAIEFIAPR